MDFGACVRLEIILLYEAYANNLHYLFNHMRHANRGEIDKLKIGYELHG